MIGNLQVRLADIQGYKLPTYAASGNQIKGGMEVIGQLETKVDGQPTLTPEVIVPMQKFMGPQGYLSNTSNPIVNGFSSVGSRTLDNTPNYSAQQYGVLEIVTIDALSQASGGSLRPEDLESTDDGNALEVDFDVHVETHAVYDPTTNITYFFLMPARPNKKG